MKAFSNRSAWLLVCAGVLLCLAGTESKSQADDEREQLLQFTVTPTLLDVFSDANAAHLPGELKPGAPLTVVHPGEVFTLIINGIPKPGWHSYPLTERTEYQLDDGISALTYVENPNLKPIYPIRESEPEFKAYPKLDPPQVLLEHSKPFVWVQDILVNPQAKPGTTTTLQFSIRSQVCNERMCMPPNSRNFKISLRIDHPQPPLAPPAPANIPPDRFKPTPAKVVPIPAAFAKLIAPPPGNPKNQAQKDEGKPAAGQTQELTSTTLPWQLLIAVGAALAMLLTPCVFPMIPVTVSFFLKQSESKHGNGLLLALVYAGTIVGVLTLAVVLFGSIILGLANNPWLNLGFGVLLMVFALSLFGMYELELPRSLSSFTLAREGQGVVGAVFMALTFSITSFTCTGPFLGVILTPVAASQLGFPTLVLLSLVYAVTFASPFFLLALCPPLLKALPKSGSWLNSVKVVMAFIEVAAALKFLSMADAVLFPGNPRLFTYDTVLCSWIALSVACGLYLLGFYRLPHDTPLDHVGVVRLLLATFFLGLALLMTPNLWHANPAGSGVFGEFLSAMLPQSSALTPEGKGHETELAWYRDYEEAWKEAVAKNKLLFIDFTGVTCQNCRYNEKNVFSLPAVRKELSNYVRVQVYNDSVPDPRLSREEATRLALRNLEWQKNTFNDISTPLYVVLRPDKKEMVVDGKLQGTVLGKMGGKIEDVNGFLTRVLKAPLNEQVAQAR